MRILFCPLGSPGFSFCAIAVAREMVARGHTLAFATEAWLGPLLRSQGLAAVEGDGSGFETSAWHVPEAVARQVRLLDAAITAFQPDVLVTTALALGPLIVGETAGLPVAVLGMLTELLPEEGTRRAEFQAAFDACRARVGLLPREVERMRGDLYLRRGVPELGCGPDPIGACAWEPAAPRSVEDWLASVRAAGQRILYVQQARSFGAPGFWPLLAEALPADLRIAASTSRMEAGLRGAPRGALVGPVVPQGAILPHAVAVLCSGTSAVVAGAMAHGLPLVTVPAGSEQFDIAALVARAGVGVSLPAREATPARLRAALEEALALDSAPRLSLREAFERIEGPRVAADQIERLY